MFDQLPTPQEFHDFLAQQAQALVADGDQQTPAVVFDRDGTLASVDWCRPSDRDSASWRVFNGMLPFDAVVPYTRDLLLAVPDGVHRFMFSGRAAGDRPGDNHRRLMMESWLRKHDLPIDSLLMRAGGDQRRDSLVKNEFADQVEEAGFVLLAAVDDRQQVCDECWRARGVPLIQVVDPGLDPLLLAVGP